MGYLGYVLQTLSLFAFQCPKEEVQAILSFLPSDSPDSGWMGPSGMV